MRLTVDNLKELEKRKLEKTKALIANVFHKERKRVSSEFSRIVLGKNHEEALSKAVYSSALEYEDDIDTRYFVLKFKIDEFNFVLTGKMQAVIPASPQAEYSGKSTINSLGVSWEENFKFYNLYRNIGVQNGISEVVNKPGSFHEQSTLSFIKRCTPRILNPEEQKLKRIDVESLWSGVL